MKFYLGSRVKGEIDQRKTNIYKAKLSPDNLAHVELVLQFEKSIEGMKSLLHFFRNSFRDIDGFILEETEATQTSSILEKREETQILVRITELLQKNKEVLQETSREKETKKTGPRTFFENHQP